MKCKVKGCKDAEGSVTYQRQKVGLCVVHWREFAGTHAGKRWMKGQGRSMALMMYLEEKNA